MKDIKKLFKNDKCKLSGPRYNKEFEVLDGRYSAKSLNIILSISIENMKRLPRINQSKYLSTKSKKESPLRLKLHFILIFQYLSLSYYFKVLKKRQLKIKMVKTYLN